MANTQTFQRFAPPGRGAMAAKRLFDIVCAACGLVALSPLFLITALAVGLTSPGGILFCQERIGLGGKPFIIYKFRTMRKENSGLKITASGDDRITPVGRILRKTKLDELPQLINVIRGDMSLVGPRPPLPREVEQYTPQQMRRLTVTPGLTCYWQATPRRNELTFDQWLALDLKYIRERGMGTDIRILLDTALAVVNGEGV